jgi:hypothetical protein
VIDPSRYSHLVRDNQMMLKFNFTVLLLMALFVFDVPLKGSLVTLALGALLYVTTTTGYGMVISSFARTQIAALFGTAILTFLPAMQFWHADTSLVPVRRGRSRRPLIPDDLFPEDQRRHLHQGTRLSGPRYDLCSHWPPSFRS